MCAKVRPNTELIRSSCFPTVSISELREIRFSEKRNRMYIFKSNLIAWWFHPVAWLSIFDQNVGGAPNVQRISRHFALRIYCFLLIHINFCCRIYGAYSFDISMCTSWSCIAMHLKWIQLFICFSSVLTQRFAFSSFYLFVIYSIEFFWGGKGEVGRCEVVRVDICLFSIALLVVIVVVRAKSNGLRCKSGFALPIATSNFIQTFLR